MRTCQAKRDPPKRIIFARTVTCPSCEGTIPLSPNWRLDSKGTGIRVVPDTSSGTCSFEIVTKASDQSPGTVSRAKASMPLPQLRGDNPRRIHLSRSPGWQTGTPALLHHLPRHLGNKNQVRASPPSDPRLPEDSGYQKKAMTIPPSLIPDWPELAELWERGNILPTEEVPHGDDNRPHQYGMPRWRDMFSPRQLLAHGYCVQAFHDLVDEDRDAGTCSTRAAKPPGAMSPYGDRQAYEPYNSTNVTRLALRRKGKDSRNRPRSTATTSG